MARGRPWRPTDRTGGPLDRVFDELRRRHRALLVERLEVRRPGDDDNVFFLGPDPDHPDVAQIDTAAGGRPPYVLESAAGDRVETSAVDEAVAAADRWLGRP